MLQRFLRSKSAACGEGFAFEPDANGVGDTRVFGHQAFEPCPLSEIVVPPVLTACYGLWPVSYTRPVRNEPDPAGNAQQRPWAGVPVLSVFRGVALSRGSESQLVLVTGEGLSASHVGDGGSCETWLRNHLSKNAFS